MESQIVIVADRTYCTYHLLDEMKSYATMIVPMGLDARLFDAPKIPPKGKRGAKPKIGQRQTSLQQAAQEQKGWKRITIKHWYGQQSKELLIKTASALWYKSSMPIVDLKWVLIKDPKGEMETKALACTDKQIDVSKIIECYIKRWTVEVTFQEVRKHLGVETQRQWSDLAIARTTPCLMGVYSIVVIWANWLHSKTKLKWFKSAWHDKKVPTFADAIASVRLFIWNNQNYLNHNFIHHLINMAARAT